MARGAQAKYRLPATWDFKKLSHAHAEEKLTHPDTDAV